MQLPPAASAALSGSHVFVGREPEMAQLLARWNTGANRRPAVALVRGEPGIGKTRLMAELARTAHDAGALVLWGRCDEDPVMPYQPFVEIVRQLVDDDALPSMLAPEVRRLLPELDDRTSSLSPAPQVLVDADAERYRLFGAVASMLEAASRTRPLLLVVDDVHWAAAPTLLMFRHVVTALGSAPVMIAGAYRDTELDRRHPLSELLAEFRLNEDVARIALEGIDLAGVSQYLDAVVGPQADTDAHALARRVHSDTRGNPFFVSQMARHVADVGSLDQLPLGVRELVIRRLSRLSPAVERALTIAAVIGPEFDLSTLEAVDDAGADPEGILDALDDAINARLVQELDRPEAYAFVHALVRHTLLGQLTGARRARLHRRIADALAAQPSTEPSVLALHYCGAESADAIPLALEWSHVAAEAALSRWAMEEALDIIERALDIAADAGRDHHRALAALFVDKAQVLQMTGDTSKCKDAAAAAADHARACGDAEFLARAAILRTGWPLAGIPDPVGRAMLTDALDLIGDTDPSLRATVLVGLAFYEAASEGRGVDVLPMFDEAIALCEQRGDRAGAVRHRVGATMVQVSHPNLDEQEALLDQIEPNLDLIVHSSERHISAHNLERQRVVLWMQRGDIERSKQAADAARQLDEGHGTPTGFIPMWRGMFALAEDRLTDAQAANDELETFNRDVNFANSWAAQLFQIRRAQGRTAELLPLLQTMLDTATGVGGMTSVYGLALTDVGDTEGARTVLAQLTRKGLTNIPRDATYSTVVPNLAELVAATDTASAVDLVRPHLVPFTGQLLVAAWGVYCLGAADRYLAMLDACAGRTADAARRFDAAVALETKAHAPGLVEATRKWQARYSSK